MAKRLLDCTASELAAFSKKDLLESMAGCEGRVMVSETIGITQPLLNDVTNAEYAAALGADVLLLYSSRWCRRCPKSPRKKPSVN